MGVGFGAWDLDLVGAGFPHFMFRFLSVGVVSESFVVDALVPILRRALTKLGKYMGCLVPLT